MDVTAAISGINYALRGIDDDAPQVGDDEWNYWLATLNRKKDELFRDTSRHWDESFDTKSLGMVTASTAPSFNIPANFISAEDNGQGYAVYVITTTGQRVNLELKKPQDADAVTLSAYITGANPKKLNLSVPIGTTDSLIGGELFLIGDYLPADLVNPTDKLPFPDPQYGVISTAAEIAFNDVTYEDKVEGLSARSNYLYELMSVNARTNTRGNPRRVTTNVRRIRT